MRGFSKNDSRTTSELATKYEQHCRRDEYGDKKMSTDICHIFCCCLFFFFFRQATIKEIKKKRRKTLNKFHLNIKW